MNWLWLTLGWILAVAWVADSFGPTAGMILVLCTVGLYVMKWTLQLVLGTDQREARR